MAGRNGVRFWGYDSALEVPFFVDAEALGKLGASSDATGDGCLSVFDERRDRIEVAARKIYRRGEKGSYELGPDDF